VTAPGASSWRPARAVVVGAGSGIGRCVALAFAAQGVATTALCRRPDAFDPGSAGDSIDVRACDVRSADQLRRSLEQLGADAVVVHTAAAGAPIAPIWECGEAEAFASLETMVVSAWQTVHECLKAMVPLDSGLVLLASSGAAGKIAAARATYSMGKAAVDQMVRIVGAELQIAGSSAGVAAFYPGMVDTAMMQASRTEAARLHGTPFARDLDSFTADPASLLAPADVAADVVQLAMRPPKELNGTIWRLRNRAWSPA
jgi:NAD(P)-dependent dehydrogenase (short-subunit alcohol dehydrogenase family)